ncbi:MAG TPA: S8 family serine peptidase, partial [Burkholderiales bacterium]|nr:S8 family serine peptidase [Burkholderiales bacterium]
SFMRIKTVAALDALNRNPMVKGIYKNTILHPVATSNLNLISQPAVQAAGETGTGSTTLVIDTGVNYTLSAFGSCTSPGVPATCLVSYYQNIADTSTSLDSNGHGTNVSGIVVLVAPTSHVAAINVFGASSTTSSALVISAINWGIANQAAYNITAINMSLGDGTDNTSPCSNPQLNAYVTPVANAKAAGIISVAASGNDAFTDGIDGPACTPGVVSVGAVYDSNIGSIAYSICSDSTTAADKVTCFSNSASFLTMLAPGARITAAGYTLYGTSQATPHVSGAIAVLRSAFPSETADQIVSRLASSGVPVTDPRNGIITPRLNLLAAATPSNDMFANRAALSGSSGTDAADNNILATKEAGEPDHAGNAGGKSVWWKWVAPASGQVSLDTHGSSFDTLLAVYTGTSVSALASVASNDNDGSSNNTSGLVFQAAAGTEYEIAVDGYNGASGNITLDYSLNTSASADLAAGIGGSVTPAGLLYAAMIQNGGPQAATNAKVTVTLDPGLSFVSAPGCIASGNVVTCNAGTLASGASGSFQITASSTATGKFVTSLNVSSDLPDPNASNNSASLTVSTAALANDADVPMLPPWGIALMGTSLALLGVRLSRN